MHSTVHSTVHQNVHWNVHCTVHFTAKSVLRQSRQRTFPHYQWWTLGHSGLRLSHNQWLRLGRSEQVLSNYQSSEHRLWLKYQTEIIHTNVLEHFQPDAIQIVTFVGDWHSCMHQIALQLNLWNYFFKGIHSTESKLVFKIRRRKKPGVSPCCPLVPDDNISR